MKSSCSYSRIGRGPCLIIPTAATLTTRGRARNLRIALLLEGLEHQAQ
jgi:hypothetical protein